MEREYQTTSRRGLDHQLPPMRLWRKAKRLGIWNPEDTDFSQDARDWRRLSDPEREHLKSDEARHLAYGVFLLSRLVEKARRQTLEEICRPATAAASA